jgi:hypothetical protein
MDVTIKEFEKRAIDAVSELRNLIGAKRVDINVHVDNFEKGCKTDVTFFTSIPADASRVPGCGPACKGD